MLVLDRKQGESVVIDGPAVVTVVRTASGRIKIGIEAAPEVKVLRGELVKTHEAA